MVRVIRKIRSGIRERASSGDKKSKKKTPSESKASSVGGQSRPSGPVLVTPRGEVVGSARRGGGGGSPTLQTKIPARDLAVQKQAQVQQQQAQERFRKAEARREQINLTIARKELDKGRDIIYQQSVTKETAKQRRKDIDKRLGSLTSTKVPKETFPLSAKTKEGAKTIKEKFVTKTKEGLARTKRGFKRFYRKAVYDPESDYVQVGGSIIKKSELTEKQLRFLPVAQSVDPTSILAMGSIKPITPIATGEAKIVISKGKYKVDSIVKVEEPVTSTKSFVFTGQDVRDVGKNINVGTGKGIRFTPQGKGETESIVFKTIGATKTTGKASAVREVNKLKFSEPSFSKSFIKEKGKFKPSVVREVNKLKLSEPSGKGFVSKSFIKDLGQTLTRKGIVVGAPKTYTKPLYTLVKSKGFSLGKKVKDAIIRPKKLGIIKEQKVTGIVRSTKQEGVSEIIATTKPPITRISKEGISQIIDTPNINIKVGMGKFPSDVGKTAGTKIGKGSGSIGSQTTQQQQLSLTQSIDTGPTAEAIKYVSQKASIKFVKETTFKTVSVSAKTPTLKLSSAQEIKPTITGKTISTISPTTTPKTSSISATISKQFPKTSTAQFSLGRSRTRVKQTTETAQTQKINLQQRIRTSQAQRIRQRTRPELTQKQRTAGRGIPIPPIIVPEVSRGIIRIPTAKRIVKSKSLGGLFGVSVRRRGKFKTVGTGLTGREAISLGKGIVGGGLGATFKITPETRGTSFEGIGTPKGFKRKKGGLFIEAPSLRLSTATEITEIKIAGARKRARR